MRHLISLTLLVLAVIGGSHSQKNPNYHANHSVMVHLFEWKWVDIAAECEIFLGPNGFGGVQVSPPNENLVISSRRRTWWERYQPMSYKLITRSGNEEEFADMCKRCNAAGVRIYVDIIANHMTGNWTENVGTGGSTANFGEWDYPGVPYTLKDFNQPICDIKDQKNSTEIRNCQLLGLKDLNQGVENVREKIVDFMNKLVDLGVAGFRIDAAKHMWPKDLKVIYDRLKDLNTEHGFEAGARPYIFQEVIDFGAEAEAVSRDEYTPMGAVTEFRFGLELGICLFGYNPLYKLKSWGPEWELLPTEDSIVFVDNHDNQRGGGAAGPAILTYKKPKLYKAAIAFTLGHDYGQPQIMSSYDFTDFDEGPPMDIHQIIVSPAFYPNGTCGNGWVCEHRWHPIYQMVVFRNEVMGTKVTGWWDNGNSQIAFCRGNKGFIAFNGEYKDMNEEIQTCLPAGTYCDIITGGKVEGGCKGKTITVDESGKAKIEIARDADDEVLAIHIGKNSKM